MKTPTLTTERLILRPFQKGDVKAVFEGWESDPQVAKYMFWSSHHDRTKTENWIAEEIDKIARDDWYRFAFVTKKSRDLIGTGLIYFEREVDNWEISYNLRREDWGKGYATEAMREILRFARQTLRLTQVVGRYAKDNPASGNVLNKLGFEYQKDISYACGSGVICEGVQVVLTLR